MGTRIEYRVPEEIVEAINQGKTNNEIKDILNKKYLEEQNNIKISNLKKSNSLLYRGGNCK